MKSLSVLVVAMALAGQSANARMIGSWTAQFDGKTYVRLEVKSTDGTLSGGISLGNVEVDKTGALSRVGEAPKEMTPIFDISATNTTLKFARKDGRDTDRFELKMTAAGRAELQFMLTDRQRQHLATDGIPDPKPFALTRQQ
jgi:hypothetical protein